ncbi:response regulator [Hymenobacter bucti]|uniref:Response regulator n=1 Tax=Hymenobacter bucti TaxID=1844114 RepID=A0ABW4QYS6_9BACT
MAKITSILLVDDDQTVNYLNERLLERMEVASQVLVALNGQEALNRLATHGQHATAASPALLLLDIKMPVLDGFGFLEAYQQLPPAQQRANVIVMLTTSLHPLDMQRLEQLPIAECLSKPLTQEKVDLIIEKYFAEPPPTSARA